MIKNYTSIVPPERSISYIEKILVTRQAKNIIKSYGPNGSLEGLMFVVPVEGRDMAFMLRAKVSKVEKKLLQGVKKPRKSTFEKISIQAERTAWKILAEEIAIKMTRLELDQTELLEAFLPYVYDAERKQTFFEKIKEDHLRLLKS